MIKLDIATDVATALPTDVKPVDATQLPPPTVPTAAPAASVPVSAAQTAVANTSPAVATAVIGQIAVRVAKAVVDGIDQISVKLNPPELGHVEVRMEVGPSGHFNAVFAADRPQTVELLQRNAHELTRSLQDAGVRTDSGSLSFNLREQNQQNGQALYTGRPAGAQSWDDDAAEAAPAALPVYAASTVGTGRVDIRV
ncbi:MAG TPA: flagellar hook-length control protein FliK [Alphaproteobacteria bacterium]